MVIITNMTIMAVMAIMPVMPVMAILAPMVTKVVILISNGSNILVGMAIVVVIHWL